MAQYPSGACIHRPRRALGLVVTVTLCLGSIVAGSQPALAQVPLLCSQPGSTEPIGSHLSGKGTIHPGGPPIEWQGPCGTTTRHPHRAQGANWHHFYVSLAEPGHLGVRVTWPDSTDEFNVYVYRGRLGENDPMPPDDQRLGFDASPGSWLAHPLTGGEKGFLFEDLDAGEYTVRVVYLAVVEGYYQGRVWSPPPASEVVPPDSSGPAERREYPLDDPGDPLFNDQWGLEKIGAPEAWQEGRSTGHGITIGIVDSGLDLQHPDFSCPGKLLILPGATIGSGAAPWDSKGHGTHVAGIAGACSANGEGGAGVAPDATIMPVNANDALLASDVGPGSNDEAMAKGIRFATDNGAHVINLSIGPPPWEGSHFPEMHRETQAALQYAQEKGVVVVAAAGNYSSPVCEFPSLSGSVICVGATDRNDHKTYYSDFPVNLDRERNRAPSVMAPGGEAHVRCWEAGGEQIIRGIVSTHLTTGEDEACGHPPGYRELPGTSMASPFVAGVAALVYDRLGGERNPENAADVVDAIIENTKDLYAPGWDPLSGWGRVDAHAAVASVELPEVSFTPNSATSGQFTDDTYLEARLIDQNGEPLEGEELVFTLTGSGSERSFTGVTDADGRSSVTPELTESPGAYRLTVRYGGSDEHAPSAPTVVGYVVDKEDTSTELVVTRDRGDKTLTARLSDLDSPADGIDGRTMSFYSDGEFLGSSDTAGGGFASFTLPPGHTGNNRTYEAVFSGDDHYLGSSDAEHGNGGGQQDQQTATAQFLRSGRAVS